MNPELPTPQFNPEQAPARVEQQGEYGQNLANPEFVGERTPEREQNMRQVDQLSQPAPMPVVPIPAPVPVPVPSAQQPIADNANPAIAGDDDLIETEWVNKAKKIIAETKDDPYRREREVNQLQVDYLRKRYGKELGAAE